MPTFSYTARDRSGTLTRGLHEGPGAGSVADELRQRGLLVLEVQPAQAERIAGGILPPRSVDVEVGLKQLAVMLRSGLTLLQALDVLPRQAARPRMGRVWRQVSERIQAGSSFADSLAQHRCFSPLVVQLVRVGEQTGNLERVLVRAAEALGRRRQLKTSVLSAFLYPTIVLLMTLGVSAFLVVSVLPKIRIFLQGLGRELPPLTQALLGISDLLTRYAVPGTIVILAAAAGLVATYMYPPGRLVLDRLLLYIPLAGRVARLSATVQLSRSLSHLLGSGITLLEALGTVERLLGNRFLGELLARAREKLLQGAAFSEQLQDRRAFMPMLPAMVAVGETSGTLDEVLVDVAEFHEEELENLVKRLSILVEPAVIVLVGGIVGFVYLAVFMALYAGQGGR